MEYGRFLEHTVSVETPSIDSESGSQPFYIFFFFKSVLNVVYLSKIKDICYSGKLSLCKE
jgi:hypothetical protein